MFRAVLLAVNAIWAVALNTTHYMCTELNCTTSSQRIGVLVSDGVSYSLLPGYYTLDQLVNTTTPQIRNESGFVYDQDDDMLHVSLAPGLTLFSGATYTSTATTLDTLVYANRSHGLGKSFIVDESTYAVISNEETAAVVRASVPDISQVPLLKGGSWFVHMVASASCTQCSSGGTCTNGVCKCRPGFQGDACDACAPGFFGPSCTRCSCSSTCDDGIAGTGHCLANVTLPLDQCNCLNGQCTGSSCTCNTGWVTASNGTQCAQCGPGFFLDSTSNTCRVCSPSCTTCDRNSGKCTACQSGLVASQDDPRTCISEPGPSQQGSTIPTRCDKGFFYNERYEKCEPCSAKCETCFGPNDDNCIKCAAPLAWSQQACVPYASDSGLCMGLNSTKYYYDADRELCDSPPGMCISGNMHGTGRDSFSCTQCVDGYLLANGTCSASCPKGMFVQTVDNNPSCSLCDGSCSACNGTSTFCTACQDTHQLAVNGTCVTADRCPPGFYKQETMCMPCHEDCAECSGPLASQCLECPILRPVLDPSRHTCGPACADRSAFWDASSHTCKKCDSSCETCWGDSSHSCLSCASPLVLSDGACTRQNICSATVPGLGVCLETLARHTRISSEQGGSSLPWWAIVLIVVLCVLLFGGAGVYFKRKLLEYALRVGIAFIRLVHVIFRNRRPKANVTVDLENIKDKLKDVKSYEKDFKPDVKRDMDKDTNSNNSNKRNMDIKAAFIPDVKHLNSDSTRAHTTAATIPDTVYVMDWPHDDKDSSTFSAPIGVGRSRSPTSELIDTFYSK